MKKKFRIALVQMKSSVNKEQNLAYSLELINEAAKNKARLICFPEFQMSYSPPEKKPEALHKLAEKISGTFVSTLSYSAKQHKLNVIATIYALIKIGRAHV